MLKYGDEVKVTLGPRDDTTMLLVGTMAFSEDGRCVLVANHQAIGMPINVKWLEHTGENNHALAMEYRARYLAEFPNTLKD